MSRVGKKPIIIPEGVTVIDNGNLSFTVKGPKGELTKELLVKLPKDLMNLITVKIEGNEITFERLNDEPVTRSLHGTARANLNNMIVGVKDGYLKKLELVGVGYRAQANGQGLVLSLGFSHPVEILPVEGIKFSLEGQTKINVEGIDKELVGQIAANIRANRPPEPYKGKGIKYSDEVVRRKEGKKG